MYLMNALRGFVMPYLALINTVSSPTIDQQDGVAYYSPTDRGGSMLINAGDGYALLTSSLDGAINFARAIGFSEECFGLHLGGYMPANLGDGNGWVNQTIELRQDYGNAGIGTCLESLIGGNHFRIFVQNGTTADSGALFLAVSREEPNVDRTFGID
ncbi:hypothetical protein C8R48DRAFT_672791 [Suillus tomentosus]|nr:hypothetical protein C8R48DRAFT_672791 [Suillus tomentosus]